MTYRVCADPPSRKELAQMLYELMASCDNDISGFMATAELVIKHPPNAHWLILMLATVNHNHRIFAKDYVRPKPLRNGKLVGKQVSALDGFFDGLP